MRPLVCLLFAPVLFLSACGDAADDTAGSEQGGEESGGEEAGGDESGDEGGEEEGGEDGGDEAVVRVLDIATLVTWLEDEGAGGTELLLINTHVPHAGEIPGTDVHIAYNDGSELEAEVGDDLDRLTVVYCKTGPMSLTAAEHLVDAGYTNIWDLPEGMAGWEAAGLELDD